MGIAFEENMEFQVSERLGVEDPERVLKALELHLKERFGTVERYGGQIVVFSASKSTLQSKLNELTVIEARAEEGSTTLTVLVSYDSSTMRDELTQTKKIRLLIHSGLEQTLTDLRIKRLEPTVVTYHHARHAVRMIEPPEAMLPTVETVEPPGHTVTTTSNEDFRPARVVSYAKELFETSFRNFIRADIGTVHTRRAMAAAILVVVGMGGITITALRHSTAVPHPAAIPTQTGPVGGQTNVLAAGKTESPFVFNNQLAVKPESDLNAWVQDWAAALRSRDPVSQGSFYSPEVDNYLGVPAASRASVIQEKMDDLRKRQRLSTIRVEAVHIERQTPSEAVLRAVKHTISQSPAEGVSETFVKTRLKLRNTNGVWLIVEEQEGSGSNVRTSNGKREAWANPAPAKPSERKRQSA